MRSPKSNQHPSPSAPALRQAMCLVASGFTWSAEGRDSHVSQATKGYRRDQSNLIPTA